MNEGRDTGVTVQVGTDMYAVTTLINTTTWTGAAADRFRQSWESEFNPALRNLSSELSHAAQKVDRRKQLIDQAANH